jgi:hypothetical protein
MPSIGTTTSSSWAAAIGGSVGLHALLWWAVSSAERPAEPVPHTLPLAVYLLPMPPEAAEMPPLSEPAEPVDELEPELEPEPADEPDSEPPAEMPPEPAEGPESPAGQDVEERVADGSEDPPRRARPAPQRRNIDWNRSISQAIARVREQERQEHRAFGRTMPGPGASPASGRPEERSRPWESQRPGDAISTGTQQVQVNDNCYYEVYAPGSLLEEAHRFSNSSLSCRPSGPAEPRSDLFIDARPDYLDLHLAEDDAEDTVVSP